MVKLAVNSGISFGAKLSAKQLLVLAEYLHDDTVLELTTFQQLYIDILEEKVEEAKAKFKAVGLSYYPVGNYVKSLRTCNFCKGAEEEGMSVAIELNNRISGKEVPFTVKVAYTGCPIGCGEPLVNDIGVMKRNDGYELYVGGTGKGLQAEVGTLLLSKLTPEKLYEAVEKLLFLYTENGKKREPFYKFVKRYGVECIREKL